MRNSLSSLQEEFLLNEGLVEHREVVLGLDFLGDAVDDILWNTIHELAGCGFLTVLHVSDDVSYLAHDDVLGNVDQRVFSLVDLVVNDLLCLVLDDLWNFTDDIVEEISVSGVESAHCK